jgi:nicotinate dehydrogenase subunit A
VSLAVVARSPTSPPAPGAERPPIALSVNGADVSLAVDARTPLLYVLRNDLGLAGTRFGCGQGLCGACKVLVDGRPVLSCDTSVGAVEHAEVTTIEGLAPAGGLHPLQRAFVAEQAGQCGYCLSGIVMAAKALLDATPAPSREQIALALDGHLCRCGAHARILRAVERAASGP